ncbi:MAG: hypothetical protein RLO08_19205 [Parvibaculaceae bacterium]
MTAISMEIAASPRDVTQAVARASDATGVDFDYLMQTAMRESGLETTAKARTSSAAGLFQFIDQTWLDVVKRNGANFGLGHHAQAIETGPDGRHFVSDPAKREEILAERYNPVSASLMAGALTRDAENRMESELGRDVSNGELYMSHFLGTGGAIDFIQATEIAPGRKAADLFPRAAAANKPIFFDEDGRAKSVREVYRNLISRHGDSDDLQAPALPGDSLPAPQPYTPAPDRAPIRVASGFSRPTMELSPMVIDILASLEAPEREDRSASAKKDRHADDADRLRAS